MPYPLEMAVWDGDDHPPHPADAAMPRPVTLAALTLAGVVIGQALGWAIGWLTSGPGLLAVYAGLWS